jgi:hypothetical protein
LSVTGQTEDGKTVVGNVFENYSSRLGLPLEYIVDMLTKNDMVVDWVRFYEDSIKSGWKYSTLRTRVDVALVDTFGPEYRDEVLKRLDWHHRSQQKHDDK